jgi:hypothetical protein
VGANREYRALISQHDLGDARGDHADAVLARANAFDDRDIGVPPIRADDQRNTLEVPCSPTT